MVAILIFAVGAGVSIYEGWRHIGHPEPLRDPTINYVVLAVAFLSLLLTNTLQAWQLRYADKP